MLKEIDEKKRIIEERRPLPKNTLKSIREKLFLEWTYHVNRHNKKDKFCRLKCGHLSSP